MEEISVRDIGRIVDALKVTTGSDFRNYAFSSFRRRIIRFTEMKRIRDIEVLIGNIKQVNGYADNLIQEITVNVTEMFRDPSFWRLLREVVLPAIASKPEINIWHAACSTGEEVFSMAILLQEAGLLDKARIIATDLNSNVLKSAARGVFKLKNQETNGKNYALMGGRGKLDDYYTVNDNDASFDLKLIRNAEFMQHDLTRDEAFSEFDLVLCRNVLIYFNSELQENVLITINKSMLKGAYLAIGTKESIRWCREAHCFNEVSLEEKVYRKISDVKFNHIPKKVL